jgi:hypothetical protein
MAGRMCGSCSRARGRRRQQIQRHWSGSRTRTFNFAVAVHCKLAQLEVGGSPLLDFAMTGPCVAQQYCGVPLVCHISLRSAE